MKQRGEITLGIVALVALATVLVGGFFLKQGTSYNNLENLIKDLPQQESLTLGASTSYTPTILPLSSSTDEIGTSTRPYLAVTAKDLISTNLSGSGVVCLETDNNGKITLGGSLAPCGAGGGGGGASNVWLVNGGNLYATTTASITDIILGGTTSSTADIILGKAGYAVFNEQGNDEDIRIEGDTNTALFFTDGGNDRVGIATNFPSSTLHVVGELQTTGNATFGSGIIISGDTINDFNGTGLTVGSNILNVSGLTTSEFSTTSISQWNNDSNYLTTALTSANSITGAVNWLASGVGLTVSSSSQNITYTFASSSLNLGTMSIQNANAVAITGGSVTGITDLIVADGGSGASTLTGLLQGNGTSAFTALTDSSTTGQVLRVTGASTYAWGALDLADGDAVTGLLPIANGGLATTTAPYDLSILTGLSGLYKQKTLTAGTNITIATSTDAITISSSGGGGIGTVATSTAVTANYFPIWTSDGFLSGTSTIYQSGGNISIGTSTPASLFTIATSTQIFNVLNTGFVGIGTSSPAFIFEVAKNGSTIFSVDSIAGASSTIDFADVTQATCAEVGLRDSASVKGYLTFDIDIGMVFSTSSCQW